jgi:anti-sigma B factor antagonist
VGIKIENKGAVTVVYLSGEIDLYTSPGVRLELNKLMAEKKKNILISFKDVSYIDSSGLATLVELYQKMKAWKGKLILADMGDAVKGVFELSRLDKIFTFSPAVKEALASF